MKQKYKLISKKLELSKGEIQEYYIDENPKSQIAETRKKDKKIYVNKRFENLPKNEKIAILYHERGHSSFYLWKFFHEVGQFFFAFSLIFLIFPILLLLVNIATNNLIFNLSNFIWVIAIFVGLFLFVGFISINYLLESIADIYSVTKTRNTILIKCIKDLYNQKENKKTWWEKYILHPSPNTREKIMRLILKW